MSTVLLMADSWQPTVLRLVPFSSNSAKTYERKSNGRHHNARGFPVLAVTRGANKKNSASSSGSRSARSASSRSARSARSDYHIEHASELSAYTTPVRSLTDRSEEHVKKHKKYPQKKIPVTHSEMKEAIRFSVQDLNDQVSSCSSLHSTDDSETKDKVQKVDNTRTALPKPSLCSPNEAKHVTPMNGLRRSVPLTPGELELQRIRDDYIVEQAHKRKKYKLNVNQLPRSTTPINDHDPDKLNMKQVIAFLQTKTTKDENKKSAGDRKCDSRRSNVPMRKGSEVSEVSVVSVRQKTFQEPEPSYVKTTSDTKYVDKTDNTRDINGCVSVLSTKSTPIIRYGQHTSSSNRTMGAISVRSYGNRSKDVKSSSRTKPVKEFKLYRFLAVAPEGEQRQGLTTGVTDSIPNVDITTFSYRSTKNNSPDSPRKFLRKKTRDTTTANLIHRRVVNRSGPPVMAYNKDQDAPTIRLPSMIDSPDEDADTCSTTSATYNSTKNGSINEKVTITKLPKKEKTISFSDEKQVMEKKSAETKITEKKITEKKNVEKKIVEKKSAEKQTTKTESKAEFEDENNNSLTGRLLCNFPSKTYKSPDFPRVSLSGPRQIHVNMPQENTKGYSQEIVRLTLRQEKSTTRVTSYMSDLQSEAAPGKWHEVDKFEPMEASNPDGRDWEMNTPRQMMTALANNNFIKVRQKLKSSNLST